MKPSIELALATWADLGCSNICFEPLEEADSAPNEQPDPHDRRIHFSADDLSELGGTSLVNSVLTTVWHRRPDEIFHASVVVDIASLDVRAEPRAKVLNRAIGNALGLANVPEPAPSVMSRHESAPVEPTCSDDLSLARLYR